MRACSMLNAVPETFNIIHFIENFKEDKEDDLQNIRKQLKNYRLMVFASTLHVMFIRKE